MAEEDAGGVTLGVPGAAVLDGSDYDPFLSKLGGQPVWHDASTAPADAPLCGNCSRPLLFVAQIYAPVESDRSIYIFGCNDKVCALKANAWVVIRNQSSLRYSTQEEAASSAATGATKGVDAEASATQRQATTKVDDSWDLDDDSDEEGADIDLNALLAARDQTLTGASKQASAPIESSKHETQDSKRSTSAVVESEMKPLAARMVLERHFPAVAFDIINEPEQEVLDGGFTDDDLMAKFSDYMRQAAEEDDATSLEVLQAALRQTQETKTNKEGDEDDDDDGDEVSGKQSQDTDEERYEAAPPEVQRLLDFQQRVKRCPTQVLRYSWADKPLWFAPLSPKYSTLINRTPVPRCRCGQAREFELQLMPHALSILPIEEFTNEDSEAKGTEDSAKSSQLGKGMDWGTIIVYSCTASCCESNTEFAIVQWS